MSRSEHVTSRQSRGPQTRRSATASSTPTRSTTSAELAQMRGLTVAEPVPEQHGFAFAEAMPPAPDALQVVHPIDPGPAVGRSRKIKNVTGPGLTDRFGMAATDLGVMTRTPSGRIIAVLGDPFRQPSVGSDDWRAPVALFSDTKNLDEGIVWSEAAGGDPHYARQLWPYNHHGPAGVSTVLPSDVITVGDVMYLHASAHFPFGNVGFTEIWKSIDDGHSWFRVGPRWDAHLHNGLAQLWTWDLGDDGWVYVMSTGFRLQRDRPLILRRVRPERIADPSAYEGWGFRAGEWAWRHEPTPVLEGGFGELCLRRIQNQWVLVVFDNFGYDLDVRVFPDMTSNLYTVPTGTPIRGTTWGQEGDDRVAQLYGPSIVPGSRLDGGFHILLSQWNTATGWPYRAMQFKIPVPSAAAPGGAGRMPSAQEAGEPLDSGNGQGAGRRTRRGASRTPGR